MLPAAATDRLRVTRLLCALAGLVTVIAVTFGLAWTPAAEAGTYDVRACGTSANNSWTSVLSAGGQAATGTKCPPGSDVTEGGLWAKAGCSGTCFWNAANGAGWLFTAPPGTTITGLTRAWHVQRSGTSLRATLVADPNLSDGEGGLSSGTVIDGYSGGTFTGDFPAAGFSAPAFVPAPSGTVRLAVQAFKPFTLWGAASARVNLADVAVRLSNSTLPAISGQQGWWSGEWVRGTREVRFDASDDVGIKSASIVMDPASSAPVQVRDEVKTCDFTQKVPCPNAGTSASVDTTTLSDGAHTLRLRALDSADNLQTSDMAVRIDNTPPTGGLERASGSVDGTLRWTQIADAASGLVAGSVRAEYSLNGGSSWTALPGASTFEAGTLSYVLPAGVQINSGLVRLLASDAAGNTAVRQSSVSVDTRAPTVTFTSAPASASSSRSAELRFSADEPSVTFTCRADGGPWEPCAGSYLMVDLADGPHEVDVRAVDAAGLSSTATHRFTVDTVRPDVSLPALPTPTASRSVPVRFSSSDGQATFECRLDGGPWSACASPYTLADVALGSHMLDVRAVDPAGNRSPLSSSAFLVVTAEELERLQLSVQVEDAPLMTLTRTGIAEVQIPVQVTSLEPRWTVQASAGDPHAPGYLRDITGRTLGSPLQIELGEEPSFMTLTASPQALFSGGGDQTRTVALRQRLIETDDVRAGERYSGTLVVSVTAG